MANRELTEDIDDLFLLISASDHTGVDQDGIKINGYNDDDDSMVDYINDSESVSHSEKYYLDKTISHEDVVELQKDRKEQMDLMAYKSKPHFSTSDGVFKTLVN